MQGNNDISNISYTDNDTTLISCLLSTVWYYKTVWNNIIIVYFKSDDCIHTPEVKISL